MENKQSAKRCAMSGCNKKLSLCDFACKCANIYCSAHRNPLTHACTFDFRAEGKERLLKVMSAAVVGKKMEVI
jgi:predicted nucleic acid binding AN1-type Zn finger protein